MFAARLCVLMALAGCRYVPVEVEPLRGPAPGSVAIWPTVPREFAADEAALLTGLDAAVRSRGYRTVSTAVGRRLLADAGLFESHAALPPDPVTAGQVLMVDAVLELEVRVFEAAADELREARWDLEWRLVSTRGGGVLWDYAHHGNWRRSDEQRVDSLRRLDAEPEVVPIGGPRIWDFRDRADLAANLHRLALAHLPRAAR